MGSEHRAIELGERRFRGRLGLEHIDAARKNAAGRHEIGKGLFVNDTASCRVHDDNAIFHLGKLFSCKHMVRAVGTGNVHRDEIGDGKHFVHGIEQRDAELACASRRAIRVEAHNAHAERVGALGNEAANAPKTKNGKRFFIEFVAHEAIAAEFARMHRSIGGGNFASRRKHERHSMLGC